VHTHFDLHELSECLARAHLRVTSASAEDSVTTVIPAGAWRIGAAIGGAIIITAGALFLYWRQRRDRVTDALATEITEALRRIELIDIGITNGQG
jgi:hypothetical protein